MSSPVVFQLRNGGTRQIGRNPARVENLRNDSYEYALRKSDMHMTESNNLQAGVRRWWEASPMTYDWHKTNPYKEGTPEFYREIDSRFWKAAWFAHRPGEEPFSRFIDYSRLPGKRVLEIGCGAGALRAQIAKHGAHLTAIDLTEHAINLTRRRFEISGLAGDIRQMDAEHMDFPSDSFDFIWSWGVIHHSASTEAIIRQIHRVLKPGGEAGIMVYHRNSIVYRVGYTFIRGVLQGKLLRHPVAEIANRYSDGLIAKYYTPAEFAAKFQILFSRATTEVCGQKVEVWPMPRGQFKNALVGVTPDAPARWLTERFGMYLFLRATK